MTKFSPHAEEVPIFLNGVMAHSPEYFPLFLCAIHTGITSGQIARLQWGDIDFNGKFLMVRRSFRPGRTSPTETSKVRRVDVSDDLLAELKDLNKSRKEEFLAKGQNEIPELLGLKLKAKVATMAAKS